MSLDCSCHDPWQISQDRSSRGSMGTILLRILGLARSMALQIIYNLIDSLYINPCQIIFLNYLHESIQGVFDSGNEHIGWDAWHEIIDKLLLLSPDSNNEGRTIKMISAIIALKLNMFSYEEIFQKYSKV
jgi:hypothetical protein